MNKTPIEWTDYTINPFRFRNLETGKVGHHCEKISPGCKNCYSGQMQTGPYLSGLAFIAENKPKGEFFLDDNALQQVLRRRKPARIFWCDMTDLFLEDYSDEWIDRCFAVMALTPHLTHQVLTKRADRMREYFADLNYRQEVIGIRAEAMSGLDRHFDGHGTTPGYGVTWRLPFKNVWLGVSVEDQQRADERIPHLLRTPAAVRFLSVEPLLGPVDLRLYLGLHNENGEVEFREENGWGYDQWSGGFTGPNTYHDSTYAPEPGVHWVIVGGESGPGARPCDIAWIRSIKDQCQAAGVPVFVKQLGARPYEVIDIAITESRGRCSLAMKDRKGGDMDEWPKDLRAREMPNPSEERP